MNFLLEPLFDPIVIVLLFAPVALGIIALFVATIVRKAPETRPALIRRFIAVVLLLAAALGPSWGSTTTKVVITDVDVFIVMDTTTSSNAEDMGTGTRLDAMKADAIRIMENYAGSRFSIISFDSAAITRLPLVRDPIAVRSALEVLDVELTAYAAGGDIGRPAALLEKRLAESKEDHPERLQLVFYLGDGEQTAGGSPTSFADAGKLGVDGAVFGYGTATGGRMRENNFVPYDPYSLDPSTAPPAEPYLKDPTTGAEALSRIDEGNLRGVASQLGVGYQYRTLATEPDLPSVDHLIGEEIEIPEVEIAVRYYWIPAIPAFALLAVDVLIVLRQLAELAAARAKGRKR